MNRFDYIAYDEQAIAIQKHVKKQVSYLEDLINELGGERTRSSYLALEKLEECYAWIGKAIRDDQIARNAKKELQEQRSNS